MYATRFSFVASQTGWTGGVNDDKQQWPFWTHPRLATLDYVDPWYPYNSMTAFPGESAWLERIAIERRDRIDGIVFFANDQHGAPVPRTVIESFARRFFGG